ncbi:conserved membrane hypothetical protein [Tenacibaculum litopenaei]
MKLLIKKLNLSFYILLIYSFVIYLLPHNMTMGLYTPNLLGWSLVVTFFLAILLYIVLLFLDLKEKNKRKELLKRSLILILFLVACTFYWCYKAIKSGNLNS